MSPELREQLQRTIGAGYVIERELGGGGMSRVFVAREVALDRLVVVKVLPPELSAAVSVERFRREIQLSAGLQHPHIVPVLTTGVSDGLPYFTMPYVDGESLRARLAREHELPVNDTVSILRDVAKALAYAHARGIVHRDIKPDNVLLSGGSAVVTDFGVAKALSESTASAGASLTSLGHGDGHARVHGAGAGGRRPHHRQPRRHLRARRDGVRDAHRPPALPGTLAAAGAGRAHDADAGSDPGHPTRDPQWPRRAHHIAAWRSIRPTGRKRPRRCCTRSTRSRRRAAAARPRSAPPRAPSSRPPTAASAWAARWCSMSPRASSSSRSRRSSCKRSACPTGCCPARRSSWRSGCRWCSSPDSCSIAPRRARRAPPEAWRARCSHGAAPRSAAPRRSGCSACSPSAGSSCARSASDRRARSSRPACCATASRSSSRTSGARHPIRCSARW